MSALRDAQLGDLISSALARVGIDEATVSAWVGRPCGCDERREKLNRLGAWAARIIRGRLDDACRFLSDIMRVE